MNRPLLQLDPRRVILTEEGCVNFYLPLDRSEMIFIRDQIIDNAVESLRSDIAQSVRPLASAAFFPFVAEFLTVTEAALLVARTRSAGGEIVVTESTEYWHTIASGSAPDLRRVDSLLQASKPKRWKAPLRFLRNLFANDGIERLATSKVDFTQDIVATSVGGLISRNARSSQRRVVYLPLATWFDPVKTPPPLSKESGQFRDALIGCCRDVMAKIGDTLPDALWGYLQEWLSRLLRAEEAYWQRLVSRRDLLPRDLWVGAGSRPLIRLLAQAVQLHGGTVTGHDHATGHGHIRSQLKTLVDFWACDTFVTFTEESRATLTQNARLELIPSGRLPRIVALPGHNFPHVDPPKRANGSPISRRIKRIMYVSSIYRLDRQVYLLRPLYLALLDWQARLMGKLREFGYDIVFKWHPESSFEPAHFFNVHTRIERRRFERVTDVADLFLFDNPMSTTFGHALRLSQPVVLIDFGLTQFTERGRELLERRCAIVRGEIDSANRWQVEWQDLRRALDLAPSRTSTDFVTTYLQPA